MTAQERRAAATARRVAAEQAGERGGDAAFRQYRLAVPGVGNARRVPMKSDVRAETVKWEGKERVHTFGYFTRYGQGYPMWDQFGEYEEMVASGAGKETIASKPDVAFLVNHAGVTMARTTAGTLLLEERVDGGWHDAYLNPQRNDVHDIVTAIDDHDVDQMSFAFMIPEGGGEWTEDFTGFTICRYDLNRGDVSAVNYGASPYTDISARTAEVLNDIGHLPLGALRAAEDRLIKRGLTRGMLAPLDVDRMTEDAKRQRIIISPRVEPVVIRSDGSASKAAQRLNAQLTHNAGRYVALARRRGLDISDLLTARLPWFEVRNAAGNDEPDPADDEDTATVYIFDEIGGSMGVEASTFVTALDEITTPKIAVRINSPGGSVFEGITIHSALLHHPACIRTYVDGLAASAASVIAMGADPYDPETDSGGVVMMPGAELMIHDASMNGSGTPADKHAEMVYLDRQSDNIAAMYAGRAGGEPEEWREMMRAETWLFGNEAVECRLADKVYERPAPAAKDLQERMARRWDLSGRYRYSRRAAAPDPLQTRMTIRKSVDKLNERDRAGFDADAVIRTIDKETGSGPTTVSDRQNEPTGRSIALIEAQLAVDE